MSFFVRNGRAPQKRTPSPAASPGGGSATLSQMIFGKVLGSLDQAVSL